MLNLIIRYLDPERETFKEARRLIEERNLLLDSGKQTVGPVEGIFYDG